LAEHAAGGGAVYIEQIIFASITSGNHVGLPLYGKAYVADEAFIEDLVSHVAVIDGTLRFAHDAGARSRGRRVGHARMLQAIAKNEGMENVIR
jgi:hypothetical protein